MQIQLFTTQLTSRLQYISRFLLEQQLGLQVEWIALPPDSPSDAWINYSRVSYPGSFQIPPHKLLFETGIRAQQVECFTLGRIKAFFACPPGADFPFDIFAATFYLISRYEEYLSQDTDRHGRFSAISSLAYQQQFLDEPIVHHWIKAFQKALHQKFPFLVFRTKKACFLPTYDVDIAFAYRGRSGLRYLAGTLRDLLQRRFSQILFRWQVMINKQKDPYDVYNWLEQIHQQYHVQAIYFFPVGVYGKYDKQISYSRTIYRQLISAISSSQMTGIHLSYASFLNIQKMKREISIFSSITGCAVQHNRFHYIRFRLPDSYRQLLSLGVIHDYSMGYPSHGGFRAGVADTFFWYDLPAEQETSLQVHPFCWMDTFCIQHNTAEAYAEQLWNMWEKVYAADGVFMPVLHNNYFSEPTMRDYREAYTYVIRQIMAHQ
ncbi:MAG: hypothetical protein IRZ29_02330 [Thermoflavifilum sp.]|nr:hypothetical protein [Thermoflavifilum sp.]